MYRKFHAKAQRKQRRKGKRPFAPLLSLRLCVKQLKCKHYNFPCNSLPALNLATFFALILITAPVWGLRPLRAALLETEKVPKPTRVTLPPPFRVLVTASITESRHAFACVFVMPASSATLEINSALFIV